MSKRKDAIGLFWQDLPKEKPPKVEKVKRDPPPRFWERPDYLPGLEAAKKYIPNLFDDTSLWMAAQGKKKLRMLFDIETYPNYCLIGFKCIETRQIVMFEIREQGLPENERQKLMWILYNFTHINFNGRKFDFPVTTLAVKGYGSAEIYKAVQILIPEKKKGDSGKSDAGGQLIKEVYKRFKTQKFRMYPSTDDAGLPLPYVDQIDLIELTALGPSLKVCAGRLHSPMMQDLPFKPGTILNDDQILILRRYWVNDLDNTELLYNSLIKQIELRESQSKKYGVDLRSHSDAQMAEAIIAAEIKRMTGKKHLKRTELPNGTKYRYKVPAFVKFYTPMMNELLNVIRNAEFKVHPYTGQVIMPPELNRVVKIANATYQLGIGGLHSQEKSIAHLADDEYDVIDTDATSYYPTLILKAGLTPDNLGPAFLQLYHKILVERVTAKKAGDNIVAECLKIVLNGTFGKLGSKWSIMYAPNLLIQVTITGQLSIFMLAERFELNGIQVTSVNTDGIVVKCHKSKAGVFKSIVQQWEKETGFVTEETRYKATFSKDINNYIAIYEKREKGKLFKTKGAYAETSSKKNAINEVCVEAVKEFLEHGTAPAVTIRNCKDIRKFTSMRGVAGGAVHMESQTYLGKVIRWYYATGEVSEIIYAKNGNKVARTAGAKPLMNLPDELPQDIDYEWYIQETYKMLAEIGHSSGVQRNDDIDGEEDSEDEADASATEELAEV